MHPINGTWKILAHCPLGELPSVDEIKVDGDTFAGVMHDEKSGKDYDIVDGKMDGNHVTFGATMNDDGVGIIEMYIPAAQIIQQAKDAEYNGDVTMVVIIILAFSALFIITHLWIKSLEKSVEFLKVMARGEIPQEPLDLGKGIRISGLTKELNEIRLQKIEQSKK